MLLLIAIWYSEEPETQKGLMLCPRSHSLEVTEVGFILWKPGFKPLLGIAKPTILRSRKVG